MGLAHSGADPENTQCPAAGSSRSSMACRLSLGRLVVKGGSVGSQKRLSASTWGCPSRWARAAPRLVVPAPEAPRTWSRAMSGGGCLFRRLRLGRRNGLHGAAVAVGEGRGVDLLELDLAVQHPLLPLEQFGMGALEFGHHFLGEQLERFADVLVGVLARLVQQHDLVDVGFLELAQLA